MEPGSQSKPNHLVAHDDGPVFILDLVVDQLWFRARGKRGVTKQAANVIIV